MFTLIIMCYSTQSSLTAWIVSVVICFYLWIRNNNFDRWNAGFIFCFSIIQLWEACIWYNKTNEPNLLNADLNSELFVKLILISLFVQPLLATYYAYHATGSQILKIMTGVYVFLLLYAIYRVFTEHFHASIGTNGHLVWNSGLRDESGSSTDPDFINGNGTYPFVGTLYLIGMCLGFLWFLPDLLPTLITVIVTALWAFANSSTREFGSYWCHVAVGYAFIALLM